MSSQEEIDTAMKDLIPFLDVLTPEDYKNQILEYVLGMTGTKDGIAYISQNKKLMDCLIDLSEYDKSDKIKQQCLRILVNLSSTSQEVLKFLIHPDFVYYMLNVVVHKELMFADLAAMLLANVTQDNLHRQLMARLVQKHDKVAMGHLVEAFSDMNYNVNEDCHLHHLGSFLSNLSALKDMQAMLMDGDGLLQKILPFTQYQASAVRRFAAAALVKNCLFDTTHHQRLMADTDILVHLVLPLAAGADEIDNDEMEELPLDLQYLPADKEREANKDVQKLLIESLFHLCATTDGRLSLRKSGIYYFMREFHKTIEEDDPVMVPLENLVQVLIGDEPEEKEHGNFREIDIPEHVQAKLNSIVATT